MAILKFTIDSILGGQSPVFHEGSKGQFLTSLGIDPEASVQNKPSGSILPVGYKTFSSAGVVSGYPMWIVTDPTLFKIWVYCNNGAFVKYDGDFTNQTGLTAIPSGAGNGMAYFQDYIYLATPTQVYRYGPLSGSPAISAALIANGQLLDNWDAGTTDTLLTDTTYIATRNVTFPNHAMHVHGDGFLYLCDYSANSVLGKGLIHRIGTTAAGANSGSSYNVLDLPPNIKPYAIKSFGTDLAIIGSSAGSGVTTNTGKSYLYLWDCVSDSFYREIELPTFFVTAMVNVNGNLRIFGGTQDKGYQIYEYSGGYNVTQLWDSQDGTPPFAGAVDAFGHRMVWGTYSASYGLGPTTDVAYVMAYGYQNERLGKSVVHNIGATDTLTALPVITALKFTQQQLRTKYPIIGWGTDGGIRALSQTGITTNNSVFRSQAYEIGKPFKIRDIRVALSAAVDSTVTITPTLYYDDLSVSKVLPVINNTNYPSVTSLRIQSLEIEQAATAGYVGTNNFCLEFAFLGSALTGIQLPVQITVETLDD